MSHFKQQILIAAIAVTATPAVAGSERLIYDPDSPYFMSDIDTTATSPNENVVLRGGIGMMSITGYEHVYAGTAGSQNLSLLIWEGYAPTASADVKVRLRDNWTLRGRIEASMGGDHTMTDYDWIAPFAPSYDPADWSHRSISPNTSLDWFLRGEVAFGRDLPVNEALSVNVNTGLRYTDVQWTAVGGTKIYSDVLHGFRGDIGSFPDTPGVRYRQQLPEGFIGVDATVNDGSWSLEGGGSFGMTAYTTATDHHYMRDLLFIDHLDFAQNWVARAKLGYTFSPHLGAYLEGTYSYLTSPHGNTDVYDTTTGALIAHEVGPAGGDLQTASLSLGLKGNF